MQGCGSAFTPRIDDELLTLLEECSRHTNRFVREHAHFALRNVFEVCEKEQFLERVGMRIQPIVRMGIQDNWSQVRYAASTACRALMQMAGDERHRFYPELLGAMCLNRHYVAEGVRNYSQDTWKFICGPQGGARLIVAHFDNVITTYAEAAQAPNHAVREAACHCMSELVMRVAGTPQAPTAFRDHFSTERVERLIEVLLFAFQDVSWPVRDNASTALGHFARAFPDELKPHLPKLMELWYDQMAENIPNCLRNTCPVDLSLWLHQSQCHWTLARRIQLLQIRLCTVVALWHQRHSSVAPRTVVV